MNFIFIVSLSFVFIQDSYQDIDGYIQTIDAEIELYSHKANTMFETKLDQIKEARSVLDMKNIQVHHYSKDTTLKKITVKIFGDQVDLTSHYYFRSNQLIYVLKSSKEYEIVKSERSFDPNKYEISINHYYLVNETLKRWINPEKRVIENIEFLLKAQQDILLNDSQIYREM